MLITDIPQCLIEYMEYVGKMKYDEAPDYPRLRSCIKNGMKKEKVSSDGKLDFSTSLKVSTFALVGAEVCGLWAYWVDDNC